MRRGKIEGRAVEHNCGDASEFGMIEMTIGWGVVSCCGNCFSLTAIVFCPFCGERLKRRAMVDKMEISVREKRKREKKEV